MNNTKELKLTNFADAKGIYAQEVKDNFGTLFTVRNLNENLEDTIIRHDLFDANDYLKAVKYGIKLAKQGYTNVCFGYVDTEVEEW